MYKTEKEFEDAVIELLKQKGWGDGVIENPTEEDLINNWADILSKNNAGIDQLNNHPLTKTEMKKIINQLNEKKTPLAINELINGKTITIKRDNPNDTLHLGSEVSLEIYDRLKIKAGESVYQIARQPKFKTQNPIMTDRRGDVMLLINGMPVFHIELKRSDIPVNNACEQIKIYSERKIFTGIFSLVQIFVAMTPEDGVYFANPDTEGKFNSDYYFRWADFNNEPIKNYKNVVSNLLSIPMAHQLIGFYTVTDKADGVLKVMRSYQYIAASKISDAVTKTKWQDINGGSTQLGGYIWHTTGSGKTITSFKTAQLIANGKKADKVVFLMDRIELGTQSLKEYKSFAEATLEVQATENTDELLTKLKSSDIKDTLIVTSIQKMSRIKDEDGKKLRNDIEEINSKRVVFIVDEAHRSTFGDMLITIKNTFTRALFFGFTGTPIQDENNKKQNTTSDIFGNELHRYSIADGIRDKNVLGFDPVMVETYKEKDIRKAVALKEVKVQTEEEVFEDENKTKVYLKFLNEMQMGDEKGDDGKKIKGIESYLKNSQYSFETSHPQMVVTDIKENWTTLSQNGKFHSIFATNSIPDAIEYYRLFKKEAPKLKITALFDPNIDNLENTKFKEDGLVEIIEDYNEAYNQDFKINAHDKFKKDIAARLAHKKPYSTIDKTKDAQIDILIVVDQMLTGFDSKWINTLYMDKVLEHANIIQAFSRTNRLLGYEKPFGTIKYYRKPHTMQKNIEAALKLYSGDKPYDMFVPKLGENIKKINEVFVQIKEIFETSGVDDFKILPSEQAEKIKFAQLFVEISDLLEAAKIQGHKWEQAEYEYKDENITLVLDETTYNVLLLRYKELFESEQESDYEQTEKIINIPYEISGYLTNKNTGRIDTEWLNSRFTKYLKCLENANDSETKQALNELHKTFKTLAKTEQDFAEIIIRDIQSGDFVVQEGNTLRDYITIYQANAKDDEINLIIKTFGLDEKMFREMILLNITKENINDFGRFDNLLSTVNKQQAKKYFEQKIGENLSPLKINGRVREFLEFFCYGRRIGIYHLRVFYQ